MEYIQTELDKFIAWTLAFLTAHPFLIQLAAALAKTVFMMTVVMLIGGLILSWVERKQSAIMQDRIGANRASIFGFKAMGLFHAIADFLKMLGKEEFMPQGANKFLFNLAPYLSVIFGLVGFAAIPIGGALIVNDHAIELQAANLNIGDGRYNIRTYYTTVDQRGSASQACCI